MRIFIDTNKYLDFYRASDSSLSKLNALISLLEKKSIEVLVPYQVYCEFLRDKEIVYREFVDSNFVKLNVPCPLKENNKTISNINKSIERIKSEYGKKIFSPRSKINLTFKKFFETAGIIEETPEILQRAYFRTIRGNPPRKGNRSFGDAIIWETLLQKYSDKDLMIICGDGDWASEIDKKAINPFLAWEWASKNNRKIELFTNLGTFLNKTTQKPKIKTEIIEEERLLDKSFDGRYLGGYDNLVSRGIITNIVPSATDFSGLVSPKIGSLYNSDLLVGPQINLANSRVCICCNKSFTSSEPAFSVYSSRCEECQDLMSIGRNCSECGKHYHESYLSPASSASIIYPGLCLECSEKKNKSTFNTIP